MAAGRGGSGSAVVMDITNMTKDLSPVLIG